MYTYINIVILNKIENCNATGPARLAKTVDNSTCAETTLTVNKNDECINAENTSTIK